jgi:outer membrane protein, heavy metal efflux system
MQYYRLSTHRWYPVTFSTLFIFLLLGGCATYHPEPLPDSTDLASQVDLPKTREENLSVPSDRYLSLTQVAVLAVCNNPDLKARRKQLGVKRAQLFSEGLLPDPQLSASLDHPTGNAPDTVNAFGLGLNYDIVPLINRGARLDSARQEEQQWRLQLLWQEWQVSQQARSLAVNLVAERQQIALLQKMKDLYQQRYQRSFKAVSRGDLTLDVAGTDLTALLDTLSQINQVQQSINDTRHALNLLMGLTAEAPIEVRLPPPPEPVDVQTVHALLETLPQRRPDLLALQAGYQSQEAKVRAAILSQFPSFSIGITRARDTGSVYTTGFNIGLNLPFFSRNRGAIAIERATREQLRQEYQARIDQAAVEVDKLAHLQAIVAGQQAQLNEYLPTLEKLVQRGRSAYNKGDIGALTFINMENTWIGKRLEQIGLDQTQRNNFTALQTLLAWPADNPEPTHRRPEGGQP